MPEAERLLERLRPRYEAVAQLDLPAHVTLLYPFLPPAKLTTTVVERLRALLAPVRAWTFTLGETASFPGVLYLRPEPEEPFRRLSELLFREYPEAPPYRGAYATVVPHLTIAQSEDLQVLEAIAAEVADFLPVMATAGEARLMAEEDGVWQQRARLPFVADA